MQDNKYNGWTNWETWLVNLHYEEEIQTYIEENGELGEYDMAHGLRAHIEDIISEMNTKLCLFTQDVVSGTLGTANWYEICKNHDGFKAVA